MIPAAPSLPSHPAEQEILEIEALLDRARIAGDSAVFDRLLTAGFVTTNPVGARATKAELLADSSGALRVRASRSSDISIQLLGDTAVVRGTARLVAKYRGHDISGAYAYTHVYVRGDAGWQVAAAHTSRYTPEWVFFVVNRLLTLLGIPRPHAS